MAGRVAIDLHVHSALSPCAADEMQPPAMLLLAEERGIAVVGIVDHSTGRNARAFLEAAPAFAVRVFVGLEIESAEGVHTLALFDTAEAALEMDGVVAAHLPAMPNSPKLFGEQHLLDEWGTVIGHDDRLLVTATDLSIEDLARLTAERGGLSIPAHIDRFANGLLPTLGFVPPDLQADLYEVSPHLSPADARARWGELRARPLITGSDAHCLADIGRAVTTISAPLARAPVGIREWGRRLAAELIEDA